MSYKQPGEWRLFQIVALRKFIKRMMRPKTHSQVYRSKTLLSGAYLLSTLYLFHRLAFRGLEETKGTSALQKAVNLNITDAKIVTIEKGRLEVLDYRREDYPELIEKRPAYAKE